MRILAVIPARGGSKGIKDKNISIVGEKPLITWTLSECIKIIEKKKYNIDFIVSTDSKIIADLASDEGFITKDLRPSSLSTDQALTLDVLKYELNKKENWKEYNMIMFFCFSLLAL